MQYPWLTAPETAGSPSSIPQQGWGLVSGGNDPGRGKEGTVGLWGWGLVKYEA